MEFDKDVWRFVNFDEPVLVQDTVRSMSAGLLGEAPLSALVETRRYYDGGSRTKAEMADWCRWLK